MKRSDFEFDRRRYSAASQLRPEHFEDFSRLVKVLRFGSRFQLLVLEFNDVSYRDALLEQLDAELTKRVGVSFRVPENPTHCVVRGSAIILEALDQRGHLLLQP
ncbi:MAG: hypothetical protein HC872_02965 [Gammaproteobacteria bacterium]|nr:hypothetical protein [Gammaproteobacteria bacterium]